MIYETSIHQFLTPLKQALNHFDKGNFFLTKKEFDSLGLFHLTPNELSLTLVFLNKFFDKHPTFSKDTVYDMDREKNPYLFLKNNLLSDTTKPLTLKAIYNFLFNLQKKIKKLQFNLDSFLIYQQCHRYTYNPKIAIELAFDEEDNSIIADSKNIGYILQLLNYPKDITTLKIIEDKCFYIKSDNSIKDKFNLKEVQNLTLAQDIILNTPINIYNLLIENKIINNNIINSSLFHKLTSLPASPTKEHQTEIYNLFRESPSEFSKNILEILENDAHNFDFQIIAMYPDTKDCYIENQILVPILADCELPSLYLKQGNFDLVRTLLSNLIGKKPVLDEIVSEFIIQEILKQQNFFIQLTYERFLDSDFLINKLKEKEFSESQIEILLLNNYFHFQILKEHIEDNLLVNHNTYIENIYQYILYSTCDKMPFVDFKNTSLTEGFLYLSKNSGAVLARTSIISDWINSIYHPKKDDLISLLAVELDKKYSTIYAIKKHFYPIFFENHFKDNNFNYKKFPLLQKRIFNGQDETFVILNMLHSEDADLGMVLFFKHKDKDCLVAKEILENNSVLQRCLDELLKSKENDFLINILHILNNHIPDLLLKVNPETGLKVFKYLLLSSKKPLYEEPNIVLNKDIPFEWILESSNKLTSHIKDICFEHVEKALKLKSSETDDIITHFYPAVCNYVISHFDSLDIVYLERTFKILEYKENSIEYILSKVNKHLNQAHLNIILDMHNKDEAIRLIVEHFSQSLLIIPENLIKFLSILKNSNYMQTSILHKIFPELSLNNELPENIVDICLPLIEEYIQNSILNQQDKILKKEVNKNKKITKF